jgi:hypothetical protein
VTIDIRVANFSGCQAGTGSGVFIRDFHASFDQVNFIQCAVAGGSIVQMNGAGLQISTPLISFKENLVNDPDASFYFINVSQGSFRTSGSVHEIYVSVRAGMPLADFFWDLPLGVNPLLEVKLIDDLPQKYRVQWPYDPRPMGIELPRTPKVTPGITASLPATAAAGADSAQSESATTGGLSGGIIAVIVIVSFVALIILMMACIILRRRACGNDSSSRGIENTRSVGTTGGERRTLTYF